MVEVKTKHFSDLTVGYTLTTTLKLLEQMYLGQRRIWPKCKLVYTRERGRRKSCMRLKLCSIDFPTPLARKCARQGHESRSASRATPGRRRAWGRDSRTRANPRPSDYVTHTHRTAHKQCDLILNTFFCTVLDYTIFRISVVIYILVYSRICFNLVSLFDV